MVHSKVLEREVQDMRMQYQNQGTQDQLVLCAFQLKKVGLMHSLLMTLFAVPVVIESFLHLQPSGLVHSELISPPHLKLLMLAHVSYDDEKESRVCLSCVMQ